VEDSKYLRFDLVRDSGKTTVWDVVSNNGPALGQIKWYPQWRRYCFFPWNNMLFDNSCLKDITFKIDQLMNDRRAMSA
jgi:hypothetical protein